jgi:hypothetical protein
MSGQLKANSHSQGMTAHIPKPRRAQRPIEVQEGVVGRDGDGFVRGSVTGLCPPLDSLKLL